MPKPLTKKDIDEAFDRQFWQAPIDFQRAVKNFWHSQYALVLEGLEEWVKKQESIMYPDGENARWDGRQEYIKLNDFLKELQRIKDSLK